jgi:hypothetical protein
VLTCAKLDASAAVKALRDRLFDEVDAFAVKRAVRNIIGYGLADGAIEGRC